MKVKEHYEIDEKEIMGKRLDDEIGYWDATWLFWKDVCDKEFEELSTAQAEWLARIEQQLSKKETG